MVTIAVDAMGGDYGPPVTVPAALKILAKHKKLRLILVGEEDVLNQALKSAKQKYDATRIVVHHAAEIVQMDEQPSLALRNKKNSSMRVALDLVKDGLAQACISAGNTGALMVTGRFVLKMLPGIDRACIVSVLPTLSGKKMRMLDLGGNVDSTPQNLFQFALMGSVLTEAVDNLPAPKVCLLNIGQEEIKGNELVKQTAQLLSSSDLLNYAGFIEGDQIYSGKADVIVCDGFVGNVALKTSEGVASFIGKLMKQAFKRNLLTKLAALMVMPILKSISKLIDPARYNGAAVLGLQGVVIKSHGGASIKGFTYALEEAIVEAEKNVPERIRSRLEELLKPITS